MILGPPRAQTMPTGPTSDAIGGCGLDGRSAGPLHGWVREDVVTGKRPVHLGPSGSRVVGEPAQPRSRPQHPDHRQHDPRKRHDDARMVAVTPAGQGVLVVGA